MEWFGGDAVICGRRKIDGRRWEGCGPGMPGPYGVVEGKRVLAGSGAGGMNPSPTVWWTGDCRAACPQAAADVHGCGDDFGPSLCGGVKTPPYDVG